MRLVLNERHTPCEPAPDPVPPPKKTRTTTGEFLRRHSSKWRLTDLGRQQAEIAGEWLRKVIHKVERDRRQREEEGVCVRGRERGGGRGEGERERGEEEGGRVRESVCACKGWSERPPPPFYKPKRPCPFFQRHTTRQPQPPHVVDNRSFRARPSTASTSRSTSGAWRRPRASTSPTPGKT